MVSIVDACFQGINVQPFVAGKGPKTASIDIQGQKCVFSLGALTSPFGAGTYDKNPAATRLGLEFSVPPELLSDLQRLDKSVLDTALGRLRGVVVRLFGHGRRQGERVVGRGAARDRLRARERAREAVLRAARARAERSAVESERSPLTCTAR